MKRFLVFLRFIIHLPADLAKMCVVYMPGQSGILLRRRYYRTRLRRCGNDFTVMPGVHISGLSSIEVGDNVMIRENAIIQTGPPRLDDQEQRSIRRLPVNPECERGVVIIGSNSRIAFGVLILGYGGVRLGEKCGVGPGSIILSESFHHQGKDPAVVYKYSQGASPKEQSVVQGAIVFKNGAGIASNVLLLPGCTLGKNAWVGPNSTVRIGGSIPDHIIAKGNPAIPISKRQCSSINAED